MEELRTIILSGSLGKKFGKYHKLAVSSTAEAIRALCLTVKGFRQELMSSQHKGVDYAIFVGKRNIKENEVELNCSAQHTIKILPVIRGSKQGVLQVIIGVILIIASFFGAPTLQAGIAMVIGGVVQMLTPQASTKSNDASNGTSYNFNGPVNTSAQGVPVPLLYGRGLVGGAIVSGGIVAEDKQ